MDTGIRSGNWKGPQSLPRFLLIAGLSLLSTLLGACGGSGSSDSAGMATSSTVSSTAPTSGTGGASACSSATCGSALLTMSDAPGDLLSYIVNVDSLQLQTANGVSVETLPATTQVDFAQLVNFTELISAGQIPAGEYVSATITVDYTNANITAAGATATSAPVALQPMDTSGNPLTGPVTLTVQLDSAHHLIITPGNAGRLAFDFNLAVSNAVNLTAGTVTVTPVIVASLVPPNSESIQVRGALLSVATMASDFTITVRPFGIASGSAGQLLVNTTSTTTYEINGTAYTGPTGLAALGAWLATAPADTTTVSYGTLQNATQSFIAQNVLAGSSAQSTTLDELSGTVIARSGATVTVRSGTLIPHSMGGIDGGGMQFERGDATVTVGTATGVTEDGQSGTFTSADISVGQHVDAFGTASKNATTGVITLDAIAGRVRLDITPLWGLVTQTAAGSLTLNLQSIDGLPASDFTFAGTGASTATDATTAAYVVNTGTLDVSSLGTSSPSRLFGFVAPFGSAPPDFTALSLTNYANVTADLAIGWGAAGSTAALTGLTGASISLQASLTGVGRTHVIQIGPETLDLTTLASSPAIVASSTATNELFAIAHAHAHTVATYSTFAGFVTQLSTDLNGTTAVIGLAAQGTYDATTNVFTATQIVALLSD